MRFEKRRPALGATDISEVEDRFELTLPEDLRSVYTQSNGGTLADYVYDDEGVSTVISQILPLTADSGMSAARSYQLLVEDRAIVPRHFFPFAVDGGGDYFFVDCRTAEGRVHFFRADEDPPDQLLDLGVGISDFAARLRSEEA